MIDDRERRRRLGIALQAARLNAKLDLKTLSRTTGIHRNTLGGIEAGKHQLSLRNLEKIAAALQTKAWILIKFAADKVA